MIRKNLFYLIFTLLISCNQATNNVQKEIVDTSIISSIVEEKSIQKTTAVLEDTVLDYGSTVKLDLQSAKNEICGSIPEIKGFEDFESFGGSLVGNDGHAISFGHIDNVYLLFLKDLSHRNSEGKPFFRILDIDSVINSTKNQNVHFTHFQFKENANNEYMSGFVTVKNDTCDQILKSWLIDFNTDKLIEVDINDIELTYNWFGYDG